MKNNFLISVPHAGEKVPKEATWLQGLDEPVLMRDVDRYVDEIYEPVAEALSVPFVKTLWHRYVVDLNRFPTDFDQQSVQGAELETGTHPKGLHWSVTTHGETLIPSPMSKELHQSFVDLYYRPFHEKVQSLRNSLKSAGETDVYHLDAHSMPSVGTALHADPGQRRADIVISDYHGTTCSSAFRDEVLEAYQKVGFEVAYNHPYVGGGITRMFGAPKEGFHNIQVELNRDLYMDEESKKRRPEKLDALKKQVRQAVEIIYNNLQKR